MVAIKVMADGLIEIITGCKHRGRWSVEDKLKIVLEILEQGALVNQIVAWHDLYPGLLVTCRRQMRSGKLAPRQQPLFLPVQAHGTAMSVPPASSEQASGVTPRQIEIELKDCSRVRVEEGVSPSSLRRMLAALRERSRLRPASGSGWRLG